MHQLHNVPRVKVMVIHVIQLHVVVEVVLAAQLHIQLIQTHVMTPIASFQIH
jgi:hypothetical protein